MKPWQLTFAEHTWRSEDVPAAALVVAESVAAEGVDVSSPWNSFEARRAWLTALLAGRLMVGEGMDEETARANAAALVFVMPQAEFLAALTLPAPDGQPAEGVRLPV